LVNLSFLTTGVESLIFILSIAGDT